MHGSPIIIQSFSRLINFLLDHLHSRLKWQIYLLFRLFRNQIVRKIPQYCAPARKCTQTNPPPSEDAKRRLSVRLHQDCVRIGVVVFNKLPIKQR